MRRGLRENATSLPLHKLRYEMRSLRRRGLRPFMGAGKPLWSADGMSQVCKVMSCSRKLRAATSTSFRGLCSVPRLDYVSSAQGTPSRQRSDPAADLQSELDKSATYVHSRDLGVALHLKGDRRVAFWQLRLQTTHSVD